jgi:hypothetical protein
MIDLLDYKRLSTWIIYIIFFFIIDMIINNHNYHNKEHFLFMPWNMSTRYYPSYDIRGYPFMYPWNYPIFYLSPFNYEADGKYNINPIYNKRTKENKKIKY